MSMQPDQYNLNSKMKYFSNTKQFEQPIFRYYQDMSSSQFPLNVNTQYTRNVQGIKNDDSTKIFSSDFNNKYFSEKLTSTIYNTSAHPVDYSNKVDIENNVKLPEFKSNDERTFRLVHDRRKNLDHSNYIPSGSRINVGFNNVNDFSKIKYGESTRDINGPVRDKELDRFHYTYRNYQHELYGSNPFPKDTRSLNKKF
jgi:hypothetical protein